MWQKEEHQYKVLLVEDNEDHIFILKSFLSMIETIALEPVTVSRLQDAIAQLQVGGIDIVLLDLMLPDSKGLNTFTRLHQYYPEIPIVVTTAINDAELGMQAVEQGAQDYLIKGEINNHILSRAIRFALVRHKKGENLRKMALVDELSQLYNRRGFMSVYQHYVKIARRDRMDLVLFMVDVDGLKNINDRHGHLEGDRAIAAAARILKETFRASDLIGRIGGDEFVILAVQASDKDAGGIRQRLQTNLDRFNQTNSNFTLSLSAGMTTFDPQAEISLEILLGQADQDLYQQKNNKKAAPPENITSASVP